MRAAADSFNEVATIRIELKDSDPLIWRQVEVPTSGLDNQILHEISCLRHARQPGNIGSFMAGAASLKSRESVASFVTCSLSKRVAR